MTLAFAHSGPWGDGDVNVELFEAGLARSRERGPERLLLATIAALADARAEVCDLPTAQLCAAAGIAERTFRRARTRLLASGALHLISGAGGRANANVWAVRDPRQAGDVARGQAMKRVAPAPGARLLIASASLGSRAQEAAVTDIENVGQDQAVAARNCLTLAGYRSQRTVGIGQVRSGTVRP